MNKRFLLLLLSFLFLTACGGSDQVRTEEYQFADGLQLLDIPPSLTQPNKNLVMEIPPASLKACEILMEADRKFQIEKAQKDEAEKVAKALEAKSAAEAEAEAQ